MASCRIICAPQVAPALQPGELPVLIDNLRASSTIVTVLAHGVGRIIPVLDDEQVLSLKAGGVLTIGEAGGKKLPGYDAGNSPVELIDILADTPADTIAIKTSNLIPLLKMFSRAIICSSLNLRAVAAHCNDLALCVIAAGGQYGQAEDFGVALALSALVSGVALDTASLACFARECAAAANLQRLGYAADIDFIAQADRYDIVPVYDGEEIRRA